MEEATTKASQESMVTRFRPHMTICTLTPKLRKQSTAEQPAAHHPPPILEGYLTAPRGLAMGGQAQRIHSLGVKHKTPKKRRVKGFDVRSKWTVCWPWQMPRPSRSDNKGLPESKEHWGPDPWKSMGLAMPREEGGGGATLR